MDSTPAGYKSGFVSLTGRPNSGKSTLLNNILDKSLFITSSMPQTTRSNAKGIYTDDTIQIIFIDTPGIHMGKNLINKSISRRALSLLKKNQVDLIIYIVDLSRPFGREEADIASAILNSKLPCITVFNKTDLCSGISERTEEFHSLFPGFSPVKSLTLSAIDPESSGLFLNTVKSFIPEGPKFFTENEITDSDLRYFASEYIRKQIIELTADEVPHAAFVEIVFYKETDKRHTIEANIHVETNGQKGIIIGKNGKIINRIQKAAASNLYSLTGIPVKIHCHVKVSPKWRNKNSFLNYMGV